ncbi:alpha/beta hydrolase [Devosia insulae DS-56]|uniref:Alpha/beta hydrolase n=1 Tax=Devosia insulae DS-56 TaxID=1116389 RepID=A0A1E5XIW0_9HYPH|nr:alpha/beta hydrolase [Devosia insulae]OEO28511.1 alpha/beta hydrolase [Devosia insulae DS-56]
MQKTLGAIAFAAAAMLGGSAGALAEDAPKPTIVLVHGAFADSSGWNGVITQLNKDGYRTVATPNPLRGVANDAASVTAVLKTIQGDVVLVGHSYGGMVITQAAADQANVKALVYVDGFMPAAGENGFDLAGKFPGSKVAESLAVVPLTEQVQDAYIQTEVFRAVFAADVAEDLAALMAATQRPLTIQGGYEPATAETWKTIPTFSIWGSDDLIIPAALHAFQAERAGVAKAVEIKGGSHALMVSRPAEVAALIEEAAQSVE